MDCRMIALDLDGTLTDSRKEIPEPTLHALLEIQKQGFTVVLASGRPTPGMTHLARKLHLEKYGNELSIYRSEPFFLELMPMNIDKAYSLQILSGKIGLNKEQLISCGDGYNDLTMIRFAGLGVAMGNAQESVKSAADYVTASNDNNGVLKVIEKFIRGRASAPA